MTRPLEAPGEYRRHNLPMGDRADKAPRSMVASLGLGAVHLTLVPPIAVWAVAGVIVGLDGVSGWVALVCWATVIFGLVVLGVGNRRRFRGRLPAGVGWAVVALVAAACVSSAIAAAEPSRSPTALVDAAEAGRVVELSISLDEKPTSLSDGPSFGGDGDAGRLRLTGTATEATVGRTGHDITAPVTAFVPAGDLSPGIGSVISVSGELVRAEAGDRSAFLLFGATEAELISDQPAWLAWTDPMRSVFVEHAAALPGPGGQLLPGLSTGETSAVTPELDQAMKDSALSHLTAVSGANCAVIVAVITMILAVLGAPRWMRVLGSLVALGGFVMLVTPEPSVVRAALMAAVVLVTLSVGRPSVGVPVLALVVTGVLIADPWMSRNYGFALSALATAGLLVLAAPLGRVLERIMPRPLAAVVALPAAAQVTCQPVLLMLDPSIPLYGVLANLVAGPVAPIATILGLIGCLLIPVAPLIADWAIWLGWLPATWIGGVATAASGLPFARLPWLPDAVGVLSMVAGTILLILLIAALLAARRRATLLFGGVLLVSLTGYGAAVAGTTIGQRIGTPNAWSIAVCDVGQGDAVLVRSSDAVGLIDTGKDPAALDACLTRLRIDRLDLVVLTHFDLDHVGGAHAVIGRAEHVLTGRPENSADESLLDAFERAGSTVQPASAGMAGSLGGIDWSVLWPLPEARSMTTGNAGSVVLALDGDLPRSIFLGDLDEPAQNALLATGQLSDSYPIVKVAHHGSADQSARLYEAIAPRIALVSVGEDNDYGHPAPSILHVLDSLGATTLRTDEDGLSLVVTDERAGLSVWTER